jgi:diadenylate cyclase
MNEAWENLMNNLRARLENPLEVTLFVIDVALAVIVYILVISLIRKKIKLSIIIPVSLGLIISHSAFVFFDMPIMTWILRILSLLILFILVVIYSPEIKHYIDTKLFKRKVDNVFTSEEEKANVIKVLVDTMKQLSDRSIGALVTIEREDSLSNIIDNAIPIDGKITQELLTTIFTPGTACHDGAVIIRKDRIVCAGAYLPTTERYDIPTFLGTRHRAAIGVSERYDAITIVVSEETGNISITSDGVITIDITLEKLHDLLDRYLVNK